jgi:hypothetical protein
MDQKLEQVFEGIAGRLERLKGRSTRVRCSAARAECGERRERADRAVQKRLGDVSNARQTLDPWRDFMYRSQHPPERVARSFRHTLQDAVPAERLEGRISSCW